jgi:hypothetical protein
MDTNWKAKYHLITVHALECIDALSDHCPHLLTTGAHRTQIKYQFKFEHGWFFLEGFYDMVKEVWDITVSSRTLTQRWQHGGTFEDGRATRQEFLEKKWLICHQLLMNLTRWQKNVC